MWATHAQLIHDRNEYLEREAAFRSLFLNDDRAATPRSPRGSRFWLRRRNRVAPPVAKPA